VVGRSAEVRGCRPDPAVRFVDAGQRPGCLLDRAGAVGTLPHRHLIEGVGGVVPGTGLLFMNRFKGPQG
jgi:hypothetical protein